MKRNLPARFWIEGCLAALSAICLVMSLVNPTWIEDWLSLEPDGGDGSTEWGWAIALALATVVFIFSARRTWRRHLAGSA